MPLPSEWPLYTTVSQDISDEEQLVEVKSELDLPEEPDRPEPDLWVRNFASRRCSSEEDPPNELLEPLLELAFNRFLRIR